MGTQAHRKYTRETPKQKNKRDKRSPETRNVKDNHKKLSIETWQGKIRHFFPSKCTSSNRVGSSSTKLHFEDYRSFFSNKLIDLSPEEA
jgi:hypothetical protein